MRDIVKVLPKRGKIEDLNKLNPIIPNQELLVVLDGDKIRFKIGEEGKHFSELPYVENLAGRIIRISHLEIYLNNELFNE